MRTYFRQPVHRLALLATLAVCALAVPLVDARADLETGRAAFAAGNANLALQTFIAAANTGDTQAQFLAGQMLAQGQGVPKDVPAGIVWLERAAKAGHLAASVTLGTLYAYGDSIQPDYDKAFGYLRPAADAGDVHAQNNLAVLYQFGLGTAPDSVEAMSWALRAERQGLLQAISLRQEIESGLTLAQKSEALRRSNQPLKGVAQDRSVASGLQPPGTPLGAPDSMVRQAEQPRVGAPYAVRPTGATTPRPPPAATAPPPKTRPEIVPKPPNANPPAAAPASVGTGWSVQVAALPGEEAARKEWQIIQAKHAALLNGQPIRFAAVDLGAKGVFQRIQVGQFPSAKEANAFCARLKDAGQNCLVRGP